MSKLLQQPAPGEHTIHFRGDTVTFTLENHTKAKGQAWLRSNIGHADVRHTEIITHAEQGLPPLSRDWHDFPMQAEGQNKFTITLPLLGVGRFEAKAYFIADGNDKIIWPEGGNSVMKVEPAETVASNTMYTAFVRQFGEAKFRGAVAPHEEHAVQQLDEAGYAVLPKSGKFRDLIKELDFIVGTLRCKIVQLLPIHPTPTTYARMGRFGSPFAVMDLLDVDPALAEFDKQTTPLDQFQELVDEVHKRNARLYLDMPINHTGWASHLQVTHPEWFHHNDDGSFMSPGAWGVLWEDLSKLNYNERGLWHYMADVFLFWCRKGADGFRCDAGYKVPFDAWQYIIAKVRMEYPDTIFMLEGLGGYKHVTEGLLADSGMNWAYSEIFQNYDQDQVDGYLPESIRVSESKGNLIHFCETHDNARLAATSHSFARLRAAFCALTSHNGAFGFANGVEWYAEEQINVHNSHSINWGAETNMIDWIRRINAIMEVHPSFHADAKVESITNGHHNSSAVLRTDASGRNKLLVLANLNSEVQGMVEWHGDFTKFGTDLLSGNPVHHRNSSYPLQPGEVLCLTDDPEWMNRVFQTLETPFRGAEASEAQCLRAKAMDIYNHFQALDQVDLGHIRGQSYDLMFSEKTLNHRTDPSTDPSIAFIGRFLGDPKAVCQELAGGAPVVTTWQWPRDTRRTVLLPPNHFLLVKAEHGFIAELKNEAGETIVHEKSMPQLDGKTFVLFQPLKTPDEHRTLTLKLTLFEPDAIQHAASPVMQLSEEQNAKVITSCKAGEIYDRDRYAVCTNKHGALSQIRIGWAELRSKYDGLLIANLDSEVPVDRHTMLTRCRAWVVARGYSNELSLHCQKSFTVADDGTVVWNFAVPVGEGKLIPLKAALQLHPDTNAVKLSFIREDAGTDPEHLADQVPVSLILRPDIEDRNNHEVTKASNGPEAHWPHAVQTSESGFVFAPAHDRQLNVSVEGGEFHAEPEWYYQIGHPVDQARGIDGESDLFSPGYFKIDLCGSETAELVAEINIGVSPMKSCFPEKHQIIGLTPQLSIEEAMGIAMKQFIVKRDEFQTVIAGYPWFLDWGRDTLICLRGIIAGGLLEEAQNILLQFAKYEKGGTIPNMIRGNDDNNRETSDAPLWLYVACNELMQAQKSKKLLKADCGDGRTVKEVLVSLATGLINGTENGITFDPNSGLIFSPSHFTWMDTNYPAGTPRQGYPIEIQAMWKYALDMLAQIDKAAKWKELAGQVEQSISELFLVEAGDFTYLADCLAAAPGMGAHDAAVDDALRSNQLLAVTLGAVKDPELCKNIIEACEQLLIPGAIRSLADRPVKHHAPVYNDGHLLNDPVHPYWGRYTGDEDSRRKPAYHNGTAWTWPFPSYAEALVMVYGDAARETALAILGSASDVLNHGCLRQSPEVIDGNTPHIQRGCGAQAWGVTELYRVVKQLNAGKR
ncbi:amylo-alpha-1,6-glucosidase [Pontiella sulfatireligans]|uniref:Alpha-1,4-glucan:maltose-1-phosphate maltosyltransferase 2 n=1 Tax=Pontiella sulfatireligans TaxID=2750658 RepID=A0A6C2UNJ9_9BACT|nr:amylo-alpha-1,6-glucosidase [Pontiella sulfatireligans]VGO20894.1 Alpha-1,4-glucan:maltose-1-phosphate maltosyltransferase 2 [Pontiella sulfatireligans]